MDRLSPPFDILWTKIYEPRTSSSDNSGEFHLPQLNMVEAVRRLIPKVAGWKLRILVMDFSQRINLFFPKAPKLWLLIRSFILLIFRPLWVTLITFSHRKNQAAAFKNMLVPFHEVQHALTIRGLMISRTLFSTPYFTYTYGISETKLKRRLTKDCNITNKGKMKAYKNFQGNPTPQTNVDNSCSTQTKHLSKSRQKFITHLEFWRL